MASHVVFSMRTHLPQRIQLHRFIRALLNLLLAGVPISDSTRPLAGERGGPRSVSFPGDIPSRAAGAIEWGNRLAISPPRTANNGELVTHVGSTITNCGRQIGQMPTRYDNRGSSERRVGEGKHLVRWTWHASMCFGGDALRLQLHALSHNIINFLRADGPQGDWDMIPDVATRRADQDQHLAHLQRLRCRLSDSGGCPASLHPRQLARADKRPAPSAVSNDATMIGIARGSSVCTTGDGKGATGAWQYHVKHGLRGPLGAFRLRRGPSNRLNGQTRSIITSPSGTIIGRTANGSS